MRVATITLALVALTTAAHAKQPAPPDLVLHTGSLGVLGLPLDESKRPVYYVGLTASVDAKGEGAGTLVLDTTPPAYDEFGFQARATHVPQVRFDVALKFVKKTTVKVYPRQRPGGPEPTDPPAEVEWKLYSVTGPKITTRLFVTLTPGPVGPGGRLVVRGADGKTKHAVDFQPPPPTEPCHPGCFPAGTPILLPAGPTTVENVRAGDAVTTVSRDGAASEGRVESVFTTTNRLIEVKTASGTLVTTETQPLALAAGGLRAAGELKAGDEIWRWEGKKRRAVEVVSVIHTGRHERVYNLILADPTLFVADGFLARSKPPATGD